jgi:hypothetical protein
MTAVTALVVAAALLAVALLATRFARQYLRLRGTRVVTCPETERPVGVEVDAKSAALHATLGKATFALTDCSRWPERHDCGRECLAQIEAAPVDCLVRTKLSAWYEGKECALCGDAVGEINWLEHAPGLMTADGVTLSWQEIEAEHLSETLQTHRPVCWNCNVTQKFRREHPELVLDNPWRPVSRPASH